MADPNNIPITAGTGTKVSCVQAQSGEFLQASQIAELIGAGQIGSSNASVVVRVPDSGMVQINVSGTWTATLAFEYSPDGGTTWNPLTAMDLATLTGVASTTANGSWIAPYQGATGVSQVRVAPTAYTSGTANVLIIPNGMARDGADATSVIAPAGGWGIRGWLSGIYSKLSGALTVSQPTAASLKAQITGSGTAGTADTGVVTVQGIASMTAVKVDGSALTQPVSAVSLPLPAGAAQDSTLTGGTAKAIPHTPAKGTTVAGDVTSANVDANTQALHVQLAGTQATVPVSGTITANLGTLNGVAQDGTDSTGVVQLTGGVGIRGWLSGIFSKLSNALNVILTPTSSGGLSIYRNINLVNTGVNIKSSAGQLYSYYLYNAATAPRFVKLYDKALAPVVGTDTPVITIGLPSGAAANIAFPHGLSFANGIGIGASVNVPDADNTAPSSNDVQVNLFYK